MITNGRHSADLESVLEQEWCTLWRRVAELTGDVFALYHGLQSEGPAKHALYAALNNALEGMAQAGEALDTVNQIVARTRH